MNKHTKQIIAIACLSLAIAVQAFFLSRPDEQYQPVQAPAALFGKPMKLATLERTLRPEGQTEKAELADDYDFDAELGDLTKETWTPTFSMDRYYISPTDSTARLILKRAFRKLENVYVDEAYDCDDNAAELIVLLKKEALIEYREYPAGLAVGFIGLKFEGPIMEYPRRTDDPNDYPFYHAMVVMRVKGGRWLLIEPLSHQVCELTGPIYEGVIVVKTLFF
jgi:hypothetical protein